MRRLLRRTGYGNRGTRGCRRLSWMQRCEIGANKTLIGRLGRNRGRLVLGTNIIYAVLVGVPASASITAMWW